MAASGRTANECRQPFLKEQQILERRGGRGTFICERRLAPMYSKEVEAPEPRGRFGDPEWRAIHAMDALHVGRNSALELALQYMNVCRDWRWQYYKRKSDVCIQQPAVMGLNACSRAREMSPRQFLVALHTEICSAYIRVMKTAAL